MFEPTSRYAALDVVRTTLPDGRTVAFARRRFLPRRADLVELGETTVEQADGGRVDLLATRTIGDPEQFWRLCDANDVIFPDELTREPGSAVRIAMVRLGPA